MADKPRFIVVASSPMPSIAYKIGLFKSFGVYPRDEDIDFLIKPDLVKEDYAYMLDREALAKIPEDEELEIQFETGLLDHVYKALPRGER